MKFARVLVWLFIAAALSCSGPVSPRLPPEPEEEELPGPPEEQTGFHFRLQTPAPGSA